MKSEQKRLQKIIDAVFEAEKISVADLAAMTDVSQVTIRKDLNRLEKDGLIKRSHGYAVKVESEDINNRMDRGYRYKKAIAKKAAELVSDCETIMVESGSACAFFCQELARTRKDVCVITNSAFIADYIRKLPTIRVTLLGGDYQSDSQALVGPMVKANAELFHVGKFFAGTDGYTDSAGFMARDLLRSQAISDMARQAEQVIVLSDASKFGNCAIVRELPERKPDLVITDQRISDEYRLSLNRHGIDLIAAENDEE